MFPHLRHKCSDERTDEWMNGKGDAYVAKSGGQGAVSCKV